jgi:hypothetical protein
VASLVGPLLRLLPPPPFSLSLSLCISRDFCLSVRSVVGARSQTCIGPWAVSAALYRKSKQLNWFDVNQQVSYV